MNLRDTALSEKKPDTIIYIRNMKFCNLNTLSILKSDKWFPLVKGVLTRKEYKGTF